MCYNGTNDTLGKKVISLGRDQRTGVWSEDTERPTGIYAIEAITRLMCSMRALVGNI